ncbi:hypothetical protein [Billgrantia gudaonensis]|uniref:Uncharacterized protein n=1 Tax=Billgrantia gudaonensis TaxID=376427 RepID=A0A1G8XFX5_9GAMM|nr:hypothetical protein [Halomonas gudaonensis]SDJ89184.1 hypothetical protein SAMN04487954_10923 [Halomonas gudaonensis]
MFAKIFQSPAYGQILVKLDSADDDGSPEVRFYVKPKNLGVCSFAIGFSDSDEGWNAAERGFENTDLKKAEQGIATMFEDFPVAVEFAEEASRN